MYLTYKFEDKVKLSKIDKNGNSIILRGFQFHLFEPNIFNFISCQPKRVYNWIQIPTNSFFNSSCNFFFINILANQKVSKSNFSASLSTFDM